MLNSDVISMPDKWEYPWYAAWDLAFHTISLSLVDFDFAKDQLLLMLRNLYAHPNGQIPGLRVELQRRESAGTCLGDAVSLQHRDGVGPRRPALPGALLPGIDAEFQLVGQPQRSARAATCLPADSSGSTTSGSSIAARRCPPEGIWTRPTALHGWRSTASACWRSRSF